VGTDLNPIAWFIVKNELAKVSADEVNALLADVEADVKPRIMPLYACDCPRGHKGKWTHIASGRVMDDDFNPLTVPPEERSQYRYEGPEIIYVFWAKHGPCQVTGCGHRTPVMSSPVMAVKTLSVKAWEDYRCRDCREQFDVEEDEVRMAPEVPLVVAETEKRYAVLNKKSGVKCPHCGHTQVVNLGKGKNKKIELSLLVHPEWLAGAPKFGPDGKEFGGSATDTPDATAA
jgi:putative DNA methylase